MAPDSVSEDGMKYTWKVSLPNGEYTVAETGADLPGYIRKTEGLGTITYKNVFGEDVGFDINNTYDHGYKLPETGGIGVYPIYALGVLLVAGPIVYGCILRRKRERRAD